MYHLICVYYGVEYWLGSAGNHFAAYQLREVYINQYPDVSKPENLRGRPEAMINIKYDELILPKFSYEAFVTDYNNRHRK